MLSVQWEVLEVFGMQPLIKLFMTVSLEGTCLRDLNEEKEVQDGSDGRTTWASGLAE